MCATLFTMMLVTSSALRTVPRIDRNNPKTRKLPTKRTKIANPVKTMIKMSRIMLIVSMQPLYTNI